jgi:hypothetical protein
MPPHNANAPGRGKSPAALSGSELINRPMGNFMDIGWLIELNRASPATA